MKKGKRKWVRIINIYIYMYMHIILSLVYTKKEARQVNQKFFEFKKGGSPTCMKNTGDKIGIPNGWVI